MSTRMFAKTSHWLDILLAKNLFFFLHDIENLYYCKKYDLLQWKICSWKVDLRNFYTCSTHENNIVNQIFLFKISVQKIIPVFLDHYALYHCRLNSKCKYNVLWNCMSNEWMDFVTSFSVQISISRLFPGPL